MKFSEILEELKLEPKMKSAFRENLQGVVEIVNGELMFRDFQYQLQPFEANVTEEDMAAEDWQLAVTVD